MYKIKVAHIHLALVVLQKGTSDYPVLCMHNQLI